MKLFGAKLHSTSKIKSSVKIWAPWNLIMEEFSSLSDNVDCYSVDKIFIGKNSVVSQYCFLCTASHDINKKNLPLTTSPITIKNAVWVAADSYIGPGVVLDEGVVVGARSSVYKSVKSWQVIGGNPAKIIKSRILK